MPYRQLADRLEGGLSPAGSVVSLPDGSVDVYYRVFEGRTTPVETRERLAALVADDRTSSVRVTPLAREPGGQAVNLARQVHALEVPVRLYGHLDDPVFDGLPFPTRSMGSPATVRVYDFEDDDLMLAEDSSDIATWDLEELRAVPGAVRAVESATVLALVNWVSVPGTGAALRDLPALDLEGTTVLVDPGDLTGCRAEELRGFLGSLRRLAEATTVVLSANPGETAALAAAEGTTSGETLALLSAVRDRADLGAAVSHGRDRAVASTPEGPVRVPNIATDRVERRTGGGDRFDGGLAAALAAGWGWKPALALGNACASRFVATAETATVGDLLGFLQDVSGAGTDER